MSYDTVTSHGTMALDGVRNEAYRNALARVITPESVVLDLGAGTGILGLVAARLGAKRVYLVDPSSIMGLTREIVAANGLDDRVVVLHGRLDEVRVPEPVDVIVSVMTGNFLLTEDLLPVLFHARDTLLKPGGHLVPNAAVMEAVPVSTPGVHARRIAAWSTPRYDVDLGAARPLAANSVYYMSESWEDVTYLAEPASILEMDFRSADYSPLRATVTFEVTEAGTCHGIAGWFRMQLGDAWLSTSPRAPKLHWCPVFLPIDPPLPLESGAALTVSLDRQPRGDWSWRVRSGREVRKHSTMLASVLTPDLLDKASPTHVPARNEALEATSAVLAMVDGHIDVSTIAERLSAAFPSRFSSHAAAVEFVQLVVARV